MPLDQSLLTSAQQVIDKHSIPGYSESLQASPYDWRTPTLQKMREGDVDGMKKVAAPTLQFNLIRLAHESHNEKIQLAATQFALAQAGHGPIQKMEHHLSFSKLPAEQLLSVIQSKIARLQQLNPQFDPAKLLAEPGPDLAPVAAQTSDTILITPDHEGPSPGD